MKSIPNRLALAGRRGVMLGAAAALLTGVVAAPAAHAQEVTSGTVSDASFVWGINGYAQKGVFGPWRLFDASGDASVLKGAIQTEYTPAPFPASSLPESIATGNPNAIKFSDGEGVRDGNGTTTIEWDGDFTFNAYPANFNAPDEKLSDPTLIVNEDGSGSLSFEVIIGAGVDLGGNPSPEVNAGRKNVVEFGAGAAQVAQDGTITLTPEYAGVEYDGGDQDRKCISPNVWGAWPTEFIDAIGESVRPHYYNTGCGGSNNYKGPLPVQVNYTFAESEPQAPIGTPAVTVSATTLSADGEHQVTVTGSGFNHPDVLGTRPPLQGLNAGAYVVFGKFLDEWRPSEGASSSARKVVEQRWALPRASADAPLLAGNPTVVVVDESGDFTVTFTVSKAAADAASETGNYGIYTYGGSGVTYAAYETATPITFTPGGGDIDDPTEPGSGVSGSLGSLTSIFG